MTASFFRHALVCAWALALAASAAEAATLRSQLRGKAIASTSPPLDHPECRSAPRATHMRDEDTVLGVVVEGRARAYPWWVLKNHHVVNDTLGRTALAVALCEQCTGGAAFRREVAGQTLSLRVAGVHDGTIVLEDRETGTLFSPFGGRGLEGPLAGRKLDRLPLVFTHWDEWVARHPDTDVVFAPETLRGGHGAWYTPGKWGIVSEMGSTMAAFDSRLPENTLVYGVEGEPGRAYPLGEVRARGGVVNDSVGPLPVVILARGTLEAQGFDRRLEGRDLTFRAAAAPAAMVDEQLGSRWSSEGEAIAGPLRGKRLSSLDGYSVEWHVWSAYHPQGDVFGREAAPPKGTAPRAPVADLVWPDLVLADARKPASPLALRLDGTLNLVVLFAAWCPPCRVEMPRLQRLAEDHAAAGLRVTGIAVHIPEDLEREAVRLYLSEAGITFPAFLIDDAAYDRLDDLSRRAGGPGLVLPTVLAVDRQGKVLATYRGAELQTLPAEVASLLGRAASAPAR